MNIVSETQGQIRVRNNEVLQPIPVFEGFMSHLIARIVQVPLKTSQNTTNCTFVLATKLQYTSPRFAAVAECNAGFHAYMSLKLPSVFCVMSNFLSKMAKAISSRC